MNYRCVCPQCYWAHTVKSDPGQHIKRENYYKVVCKRCSQFPRNLWVACRDGSRIEHYSVANGWLIYRGGNYHRGFSVRKPNIVSPIEFYNDVCFFDPGKAMNIQRDSLLGEKAHLEKYIKEYAARIAATEKKLEPAKLITEFKAQIPCRRFKR